MRKLVLLLVLVAVFGGGRFWLARETERRFDQALANLPKSPWAALSKERYESGLWGAHAVTRVTIARAVAEGEEKPAPAVFDVEHRIDYGPIVGFEPAVAVIETRVRLPQDVERGAKPPIGPDPLLAGRTFLPFGGGTATRIAGTPYEGELEVPGADGPLRVRWQGAEGLVTTGADGRYVEGRASFPDLVLESSAGRLELHAAAFRGRGKRSDAGPWTGETTATTERIATTGAGRHIEIEGISSVTASAADDPGAVQATSTFLFGRLLADGLELRDGQATLTARRLDEGGLAELQAIAVRAGADPGARDAAAVVLRRMLVRSPEIALDPVKLTSPSGPVHARALVGFDGEAFDPDTNVLFLLLRARASAEIDLPRALLEAALEPSARQTLAGAGAPLEESSVQDAIAGRIAKLVEDGFVVLEGDRAQSRIAIDKGKLELNGRGGEAVFPLVLRALLGGF